MKIRNVVRENPSLMSAIGALMVFLAWFLNATVLDRVTEITRQIERLDQQQFVNDSLEAVNRKLNNLAIELSGVGDPRAETTLDAQVNRVSARLKERIALDESYQDVQRHALNLLSEVDSGAVKPKGLYLRVAETHNKIAETVQKSAMLKPGFKPGTTDYSTEIEARSTDEAKHKYVEDNEPYLQKVNLVASDALMTSLSNELSQEEDELVKYMKSQREARERESTRGNVASGLLFALGTALTIYSQWIKDSSEGSAAARMKR